MGLRGTRARYPQRDDNARNALVEQWQGLPKRVAMETRACYLDLDDAIAAGNLGLIRAAELYDPSLGYTFTTYAWDWIRQAIGRANLAAAPIFVPNWIACPRRKDRLEPPPGPQKGRRRIKEALACADRARRVKGGLSGGTTGLDPSDEGEAPDETLCDQVLALRAAWPLLDEEERELIGDRYGQDHPCSAKETAARLGVTTEWVRRKRHAALAHLRRLTTGAGA